MRTSRAVAAGQSWQAGVSAASGPHGWSPASLRSAYKLATAAAGRGRGKTVAVVDAFSDPKAASDLAAYRSHYGLPACGTGSGCLRIVNQWGHARNFPRANSGWAAEESLDLDMVSAICPHCRIVLVEARNTSTGALGTAEDTAVRMGARFVSNSWGGYEFVGERHDDHYFDHPGVVIDFAAGDSGYGAEYPADIQYVTAVGGTTLHRSSNKRGWHEHVWSGTGSGCSILAAKAPWQSEYNTAAGCLNRIGNDVAAVADPRTGVSVYDSYKSGGTWLDFGGTSVAAPIVTAAYALAGNPKRGTYPASYPYHRKKSFFDISSGSNGSCGSSSQVFLCHGEGGYDGPTGLGTPDGIGGLESGSRNWVTVTDPGVQDVKAGTGFWLRLHGYDADAKATSLAYSASGLPAGLSIAPVAGTLDATITGTLPAAGGTYPVTVTAKDTSTGRFTHVSFSIVVVAGLTAASAPAGAFHIGQPGAGYCLDAGAGTAGTPVTIQPCDTTVAGQSWTYRPGGYPGGPGQLRYNGQCLGISSGTAVLTGCGPAPTWFALAGFGALQNPRTGSCLAVTSLSAGTAPQLRSCNYSRFQTWDMSPSLITSGTSAGLCLNLPGTVGAGTHADVALCDATSTSQQFTLTSYGQLQLQGGNYCLTSYGNLTIGSPVNAAACSGDDLNQIWIPGPGGELVNAVSGLCLGDPNGGGAGTDLTQQGCFGQAGVIWAYN